MTRMALIATSSFLIWCLGLTGCAPSRPKLDTFGMISEFQLTAHTGKQFNGRELNGKIWVADFIFANCNGPCPRMTSQMRRIQDATAQLPNIRLVSFTVDPERDTPEALAAYARRNGADERRWTFLTGPRADLHRLKRETFLLGDVDGSLNHSTRFVLVDESGRIRGFYPTAEEAEVDRLIADLRALAGDHS